MLSKAYFLAKFRFDTAENEPAKSLQKIVKFANFAKPSSAAGLSAGSGAGAMADTQMEDHSDLLLQKSASLMNR